MLLRGREKEVASLRLQVSGIQGAYLLLGAAGCGKTALASHIGMELAADPTCLVLAYSADAQPDDSFRWRRNLKWASLGGLLDSIEADLQEASHGSLQPANGSHDRITAGLIAAANGSRRVAILIDGLEQLLHDEVGKARLVEICGALPPQCYLLLAGRRSLVFLQPELLSLATSIPVEGLTLSAFREVAQDMAIILSDDELRRLFREFAGMPGSLAALRGAPHLDKLNDYGRTVEETHVRTFVRRLKKLSDADQAVVEAALKILVVSREAIGIGDLFRLLGHFPITPRPATPDDLWVQMAASGVLELRAPGDESENDERKLKLHSDALRDALRMFFFADKLTNVHVILAERMEREYPFDRHNKLYHALNAFRTDSRRLAAFAQSIPWPDVLSDALRDNWQGEDNLLLLDFTHLLENLPKQASKALAKKLLKAQLGRARLETTDRLRLEELLSTARNTSSMQTATAAVQPLRILLDVWPGYFPILAMEKELHAYGIDIGIVNSSSLKYQMLLEGSADLIGTTPGCLSTLPHVKLRRYELIGVLNRSNGNDQILADHRTLRIVGGRWTGEALSGNTPRALVVKGSTGHLFLLWYLSRLNIPPQQIAIEYAHEYVGLNQTALDSDRFNLISTWEPFASLAVEGRPSLQPVFRSSEPPSVVFDILIGRREGGKQLDQDSRLQHFWAIYDSCLATQRLKDRTTREELVGKYKLDPDKYDLWIDQMHFFQSAERKHFFSGDGPSSLPAVLDRIAATWSTAGESLHAGDQAWREDLRQLAANRPHWIFAQNEEPGNPPSRKATEITEVFESMKNSVGQRLNHQTQTIYEARKEELIHEAKLASEKKWARTSDEARKERLDIEEKWRLLIATAEQYQRDLIAAASVSELTPIVAWLDEVIV